MRNLNEIESELQIIKFGKDFKDKLEIKELSKLMDKTEHLRAIVNADFLENTGILVLTNKNLFFLSEVFGEIKSGTIPLLKVASVIIDGQSMEISKFDKTNLNISVLDYGEVFDHFISELKKIKSINNVSVSNRLENFSSTSSNSYNHLHANNNNRMNQNNNTSTHSSSWAWTVLGIIIFGFLFFSSYGTFTSDSGSDGYYPSSSPSPSYAPAPSYDPNDQWDVLDYRQTSDGYFNYIEGRIQNNSNENFYYAQVDIVLYDAQGNVVESTFDNINHVGPGEVWSFKAMIFDGKGAAKYKIKDVFGYY